MQHISIQRCIHTANLGFPPQIIYEICSWKDYCRNKSRSQNWYMTLCYPKMQPHTKFGIPSSNNIEKKCSKHDYSKTRSEVKVTLTQNWYATLGHPKMHPHTKFGTHTLKNIEVMHQTQCRFQKLGQRSRSQWPENGTGQSTIPRCIHIPNLGFLPKMIRDMS